MSSSELGNFVGFAAALADIARETLANELSGSENSASDIEVKPDRSLVTKYDRAIEHRLRVEIRKQYPHHGIIGEEEGSVDTQASHVWILDPIDGTAPFIVGIPVWGTLIALAIDGVPQVGVIDNPVLGTRWIGATGQNTRLNDQAVRCRPCESLATALMTNSNQDYMSAGQLPALNALRRKTANRVYGGACLNYGRLAEGRTDLAIDAGQQIYDFAPYRPIIEGAGGKITDWQGQPLTLASNGTILAAGDERCHAQALEVVNSSLKEAISAA
ncbi:inositol monophosphatase family protein [Brucella sp. TWI432]